MGSEVIFNPVFALALLALIVFLCFAVSSSLSRQRRREDKLKSIREDLARREQSTTSPTTTNNETSS